MDSEYFALYVVDCADCANYVDDGDIEAIKYILNQGSSIKLNIERFNNEPERKGFIRGLFYNITEHSEDRYSILYPEVESDKEIIDFLLSVSPNHNRIHNQ